MSSNKKVILFTIIFALAGFSPLASAAGGGGGGGAVAASVTISGFQYNSNNVTINMGETVEWSHQDSAPHTVTDNGGPEPFDSGDMTNGDTFSFTFNLPGNYPYICNVHPSMTGMVHVVDPNAGSGSNNSDDQDVQNETSNVTMTIWMPEGIEMRTQVFEMDNSSNLWDASQVGFAELNVSYQYTDDPNWGVFLNSIAGLSSDVAWGEPEYWYWSLYLMNSTGLYVESSMGVSSVNVSEGLTFSWVATNGSWGPMEGSVSEMLDSLNNTDNNTGNNTDNNTGNNTDNNSGNETSQEQLDCEANGGNWTEAPADRPEIDYYCDSEDREESDEITQEECEERGLNWTESPDRPGEFYCDTGDGEEDRGEDRDEPDEITQVQCEERGLVWMESSDRPGEFYCDRGNNDGEQIPDNDSASDTTGTNNDENDRTGTESSTSKESEDSRLPGFSSILTATALLGAVIYLGRKE